MFGEMTSCSFRSHQNSALRWEFLPLEEARNSHYSIATRRRAKAAPIQVQVTTVSGVFNGSASDTKRKCLRKFPSVPGGGRAQ